MDADPEQGQPTVALPKEVDRRGVLRGAAALGALGIVSAYAWRVRDVAHARNDETADLLNLAITMESLLCDAYQRAIDSGHLTDEDRVLVQPILDHQIAYVDALTQAVRDYGAAPVEKPTFRFDQAQFADRNATLTTLYDLEEIGLAAWQGQIPSLTDPSLVPFARPILMAKPRHCAVTAWLCGSEPIEDPIEPTTTLQESLDALAPYRGMG